MDWQSREGRALLWEAFPEGFYALKTKLAVAGAIAGAGGMFALAKLLSLVVEQPEVGGMIASFLWGVAGAAWVWAFVLVLRLLSWREVLNRNWPIEKSVRFRAEALTEDNLWLVATVSVVNLAPSSITVEPPDEVAVRLVGKDRPRVKLLPVETAQVPLMTPAKILQVGIDVSGAPQPYRGRIDFRCTVHREYTRSTVIQPNAVFLGESAKPGFRVEMHNGIVADLRAPVEKEQQ